MAELFGVSEQDAAFISQGKGRRVLGAVTDGLRSSFWELARTGYAQSPIQLTSEQVGDLLDARQRSRDDIAHRVLLRRLARTTQRNQKEPTILFGRTTGRIAIGVAGAAAVTSMAINVPAAIADANAATHHYQTVLRTEQTIANNLSPQARMILYTQLEPAAKSLTSSWAGLEAGQTLRPILQEEQAVVGSGTLIGTAQQELSKGDNAGINSLVRSGEAAFSTLGLGVAGGLVFASRESRRKRYW